MNRRRFLKAVCVGGLALGASACGASAPTSGGVSVVWGRCGAGRGAFRQPRAVAVLDSETYVIDRTGRVQVFDEAGGWLRGWALPEYENGTPTGLAFSPDGRRVVIPDTHYNRILEYDREGRLLEQWGAYGRGPGEFIYPTGIAVTARGAFCVSEYGEDAEGVRVFGPDRRELARWGGHGAAPGKMNRAMAVAFDDARGWIHVCDTANHRIQTFTLEGELVRVFGNLGASKGALRFPYDAALDAEGRLWVVEYGNHRVSRFSPDGVFEKTVGSPGRRSGQFSGPRGVAVAGGWLVVADTDNHRMQRLKV